MVVMSIETGGTFKPSIENPNGAAVGLIQFIPSTAKYLGTSYAALKKMSHLEQLKYVGLYLAKQRAAVGAKSIDTFIELYELVFQPAGFRKADTYLVGKKGSRAYDDNATIDTRYGNKDGVLTMGDFRAFAAQLYAKQVGGTLPGWTATGTPTKEKDSLKTAATWLFVGTAAAVLLSAMVPRPNPSYIIRTMY